MQISFEYLKNMLGEARYNTRKVFAAATVAMLLTTSLMIQARTYADDVPPESVADLDSGFGNAGKVMTQVNATTNGNSSASAVAIQKDGKLVVAGGVYQASDGDSVPNSYDFALARYRADGTLDTSFGSAGKVTTDFFGFDDFATAIVIQADGKIVAAGGVQRSQDSLSSDFGLARYNADGSLDSSFGKGGKVLTDFLGFADECRALALQADGKIIAAGNSGINSSFRNAFAVVRYNTDGSLDAGFGNGGKVTTDFAVGSNPVCYGLAVQADGKVVGVGNTGVGIGLARFNSDGTLDSSFGTGGKTTTEIVFPNSISASAVTLQPDGRIVVAGDVYHKFDSTDFALARYDTNGVLDPSFGKSGVVSTSVLGFDHAYAVSVRPDGKIVEAGRVDVYSSDDGGDFGLAQFNADGTLDTTFGSNGGVVHTAFLGSSFDRANGLVLQPDGRVVLAGLTEDANGVSQFALARYGVATVPPAARVPIVQSVTIQGKKLIVTGSNYDIGAVILMDGEKQKSANDDVNPEDVLIAKKAGKFITPGQTVTIQVRNVDDRVSNSFVFTRPE